MTNNTQEFLVTGQGYEKNDQYKQTILLHETFFTNTELEAQLAFQQYFEPTHKVMKIYSVIDITKHRI